MAKPGPKKGSKHCTDWVKTGKLTPKRRKPQRICAKYAEGKKKGRKHGRIHDNFWSYRNSKK